MELTKTIDFQLLRRQKMGMLELMDQAEKSSIESLKKSAKKMEGLVDLIDTIQDYAADVMGINNIFNLEEKRIKWARQCDECGLGMNSGHVISGGDQYYCSETCLHKHYTEEQYLEMHGNGEDDTYYTEWEDEDEYQFQEIDGEIHPIEEVVFEKEWEHHVYFLFGSEAVDSFDNDGLQGLIDDIDEQNVSSWDLHNHNNLSSPVPLISHFDGYRDYSVLQPWEYFVIIAMVNSQRLNYSQVMCILENKGEFAVIVDFSGVEEQELPSKDFIIKDGIIYPVDK
jgi:hypothetical protein